MSGEALIRGLRLLRLRVIHPSNAAGDELVRHLQRIGCQVEWEWPIPRRWPSKTDVVFCLFGEHWIQDVDALEIERDGTIIGIVEYESPTIIRRLLEADVQAVIGKPIRPFGVLSTLVVATSRYRFECRQTAKILKLEDTLKSRRVVNKAVGKLATERGMSDDAAYQFIRRCSLERHLSMTKVADLILSDEEPGLFKPL